MAMSSVSRRNNNFTSLPTLEEFGLSKARSQKVVLPNNVLHLLKNKHSWDMYERHVSAIRNMVRTNSNGLHISDLQVIHSIVSVCKERLIMGNTVYSAPLCELITLCAIPFRTVRVSDEERMQDALISFFSLVGSLWSVGVPSVQIATADMVYEIASVINARPDNGGLGENHNTSSAFHIKRKPTQETALLSSTIVIDLMNELRKSGAPLDHRVQLSLLQALSLLSCSPKVSFQILSDPGACNLLCTFLVPRRKNQCIFVVIELLWNLLESDFADDARVQLGTVECLTLLKNLFVWLVSSSISKNERQLRNDVIILAVLIAREPSTHDLFIKTGMLSELLRFVSYVEFEHHDVEGAHKKFLCQDDEDFQLKNLLLSLIVTLSNTSEVALRISTKAGFIALLFIYINPIHSTTASSLGHCDPSSLSTGVTWATLPPINECRRKRASSRLSEATASSTSPTVDNYPTRPPVDVSRYWNTAQFDHLRLQVLKIMFELLPKCLTEHMELDGNVQLLLYLDNCLEHPGQPGFRADHLQTCIHVLQSICMAGDSAIKENLGELGCLDTMLYLLRAPREARPSQEDSELRMSALLISSTICRHDHYNKELFSPNGVLTVLKYLHYEPSDFNGDQDKLLMAAVDCVWSTVISCAPNEESFLRVEGVFILLDLLETCPMTMKNLILGTLVDLSENPKVIPHIQEWRSQTTASSVIGPEQMLISLWEYEEKRLGVLLGEAGTIEDLNHPLVGAAQSEVGILPRSATRRSIAIEEVSSNMRAKIYSIFCRIGFGTNLDSESCKALTTTEKVKLAVIERYLDFKVGEVWQEIEGELQAVNIRPVTPDQECINEALGASMKKAVTTGEIQRSLVASQRKKDLEEEKAYYDRIRENHCMAEKAQRDFTDYVSRTSNFETLKAAKKNKQDMVRNSRAKIQNQRFKMNNATFDSTEQTKIPCDLDAPSDNASIDDDKILEEEPATEETHITEPDELHTTTFCGRHVSLVNGLSLSRPLVNGMPLTNTSIAGLMEALVNTSEDSENESIDKETDFCSNEDADLGLSMDELMSIRY